MPVLANPLQATNKIPELIANQAPNRGLKGKLQQHFQQPYNVQSLPAHGSAGVVSGEGPALATSQHLQQLVWPQKSAHDCTWMSRMDSQDLICSEELDLPSSLVSPQLLLCDEAMRDDASCYYETGTNTSCSTKDYYSCRSSCKARLELSRIALYTDTNSPETLAWCNDIMQKLKVPGRVCTWLVPVCPNTEE
jgi:hypothetical protein